jgi:hypothetical protein
MLGLTSQEILRYRYLPARSEERWVSLHFFFFFLLNICNFYVVFYIYHFFIPEHLTDMCLLCADVGPVRPVDYARNRRRPRPGAAPAAAGGPTAVGELPAGEAERVLR